MATTACPFCGVATDVPHETQEGCIEALQREIARMRRILVEVTPPQPRPDAEGEDDPSEPEN